MGINGEKRWVCAGSQLVSAAGGGWGARSTAVLPSVQKWGFGAGSKEEELSAGSGASVVPLLRVGAAGRYCWCCQDLEGGGGGYCGAPSAVSQASTSPSTLCFSLVLINGCSAVPPIKSNLLKRFGVLICNQRVAAFITMEMAQAVLSRPAAGGRCAALQFGWGRGSERGEGRCVTANGAGRQREAPRPAPCGTGRHEGVLCFGTGCAGRLPEAESRSREGGKALCDHRSTAVL